MAKTYQTAILIKGDASGGVKAIKATKSQVDSLNKSVNQSGKAMNNYKKSVAQTGKSLSIFSGQAKAALGVLSGAALAREAIDLADSYKQMEARLRLATDSQYEFNQAQDEIVRISRETHTALDTNVTLYSRMAIATKELDIEQRTLFEASEALQHSFRAYGTSSEEAASATLQLTQAMAKGKLDGDEFRSVMENAPLVMEALKDSLGITKKELFEFSASGKLSVEDLVNSLAGNLDKFKAQSADVPTTVREAVIGAQNEITLMIGEFDKATGASDKLVQAIGFLGENFDTLITIIGGGVAIKLLAPALAAIGTAAITTTKSIALFGAGLVGLNAKAATTTATMNGLNKALLLVGGPAGLALLGGVAAWQGINTLIDARNEKLERYSQLSEQAVTAINKFNQAQSGSITESTAFTSVEAEIDGIIVKIQELETRRQNFLKGGFSGLDARGGSLIVDDISDQISGLNAQLTQLKGFVFVGETAKTAAEAIGSVGDGYDYLVKKGNEWQKTIDGKLKKAELAKLEREKELAELSAAKANYLTEEQQLLADYGTQAEQLAVIEEQRTEALAEFIRLGSGSEGVLNAINAKYDDMESSVIGVTKEVGNLNNELEQCHQGELPDMIDLMDELGLTAAGDERYFNDLAQQIDFFALSLGESHPAIIAMREELARMREEAGLLNNEFKSSLSSGLSDGITGLINGGTDGFINSMQGVMDSAVSGFADVFSENLVAGKGVGGSFSAGFASIPVAGWIAAGLAMSDGFFQDGWRIDDAEFGITPLAAEVHQLTARISDMLGINERTANLLDAGASIMVRLFGRKAPEIEQQGYRVGTGADGLTGESFANIIRKGGVFRSDRRYTETGELTDDVDDIFNELIALVSEKVSGLSRALGIEYVGVAEGAFEEVYNKKGELIDSFSTFFGVVYKESIEEFGLRLQGESIIAQLGDQFGDAHTIANLWRDNAEQLLEGSTLLAAAAINIKEGRGLFDNLEATTYVITEMQRAGESLTETYERVYGSTILLEDAFGIMGQSFEGGRDEFIELAAGVTEAAGGLEKAQSLWSNFFTNFYDPQELLQQDLGSASQLLGQQASNLGLDPSITAEGYREAFEQALAGGLSDEDIVAWLELGQSITNVTDLIDRHNEAIQEQIDNLQAYIDFNQGIQDQLDAFDMTDFQLAMRDIERQEAANVAQLEDLAVAAGMAQAAEEDLARVHELSARQAAQAIAALEAQTQSLISELYGTEGGNLDEQIAQLESQLNSGVSSVGGAADNLFDSWQRAIEKIRDYSQSLLIDNRFSPLEAEDRLAEAQSQFYSTLALAQGGDLDAANELTGLASTVLDLGQLVHASGDDYNQIFYAIQDALGTVDIPSGLGEGARTGGGTVNVGVSAELQALYDRQAAQEAAGMTQHRLELAQSLAIHVTDLARAMNVPVLNQLTSMGVNLNDFLADLGIGVENATAETVVQLAQLGQTMGITVTDLANEVSLSLGSLADEQSLLNDGLEQVISGLPQGIQQRLDAGLSAIEQETDPTLREAYLSQMTGYINTLPADLSNQLAPFFGDVVPTTAATDTATATTTMAELLGQVITVDGMTIAGLSGLGDIDVNLDTSQFGTVTSRFQNAVNDFIFAVDEFSSGGSNSGGPGTGPGDNGNGDDNPIPFQPDPNGTNSMNAVITELKSMKQELAATNAELRSMKSMQRTKFDEQSDLQRDIAQNTGIDRQPQQPVPPRTLAGRR